MMQFSRPSVALLITVAMALASSGFGCSTGAQPAEDTEQLIAWVDSVRASFSPSSDTLRVHLYGTVGPDGCHTLDHIAAERSSGRLTLTPVVTHRTTGFCTMAVVPLDATYEVAPPFEEDALEIVVPQPNRDAVTTTIQISSRSENGQ